MSKNRYGVRDAYKNLANITKTINTLSGEALEEAERKIYLYRDFIDYSRDLYNNGLINQKELKGLGKVDNG